MAEGTQESTQLLKEQILIDKTVEKLQQNQGCNKEKGLVRNSVSQAL